MALGSRFGYIEFDLDPKSPHFEEAFVESVTLALTTTAQETSLQVAGSSYLTEAGLRDTLASWLAPAPRNGRTVDPVWSLRAETRRS